MTDEGVSRRERWAAADAARAEKHAQLEWGMDLQPDERDVYAQARQAFERGDRWFQVDIPVSYVRGRARMGATSSLVQRRDDGDVIGTIESFGWALEHVAATFVVRGHASTKRLQIGVMTSADDIAYHGELVGLYIFRRADQAGMTGNGVPGT